CARDLQWTQEGFDVW
nr:immunoglobulin heavy chain junction region [Macaca mulatta]